MGGDSGIERNAELAEPVVDPGLPAAEHAGLTERVAHSRADHDTGAGCFGAMVAVMSALGMLLLHVGFGLAWWWMLVSVIPATFGLLATRHRGDGVEAADRGHFIHPAELDKSSHKILLRAQRAIAKILDSDLYARTSRDHVVELDHVVEEATLRRHEWEVASALRQISRLRAELAASQKAGSPGPMTAAVLDSHRRALELATDATRSRVRELERYASELKEADAAARDWQAAARAARRNDEYLDLVARTAADEHAVEELREMTEQAAAAAGAFRDHLRQADLAAQALVLPPAPQD